MQQWVELGAAGVAALIGTLTVLVARPVARRPLWGREPGFWLLFGPVAIVLQNLVDITWYVPAIYLLFLFEARSPLRVESGCPGS